MLHSDFGGESLKPMGLLLIHLDEFETHEESHACKVQPTKQLKGKDAETGAWNIGAAKEYPPLLSAALPPRKRSTPYFIFDVSHQVPACA